MISNYKKIAFVLAHQDDEIPIAWLIKDLISKGIVVRVYLMTSGSSRNDRKIIATRNREFTLALEYLGLGNENIFLLGNELDISDGKLSQNLRPAYEKLRELLSTTGCELVVSLCNEGGHQDHDACNFISRCLRESLGVSLVSYSLYNGFETKGKFFRTCCPIEEHGKVFEISFPLIGLITSIRQILFYRSQRKTWFGLLPFMFFKLCRLKLKFQKDNSAKIPGRPHEGALLYERYQRDSYENIRRRFLAFFEVAS